MSLDPLILDSITYTYPGSIRPVFTDLSAHFSVGWTGIVGANGSGKTTVLRIAAGELVPERGTVMSRHEAVLCAQRTDYPPEEFEEFLDTVDADAFRLRGQLGIMPDWRDRWDTLSHGERKRAQIGAALWLRPQLLAADEPTNHIDHDTRLLLMQALEGFNGIGLIVSHDRMVLDTLCRQCLFLGDDPVMRPGGYSQGMAEQARELDARRRERDVALADLRKLKRETSNRRAEASQADRKRSKRGLSWKDHDGRAKRDLARVSGKDGAAGKRLNQLAGRLSQAEKRLDGTTAPRNRTLGIRFDGTHARRDFLWRLDAGALLLGTSGILHYPVLAMQPEDRVGITGANGTGKSTLVRHIVDALDLPPDRLVYIPQEVTSEESSRLGADVRRLPRDRRGRVMELISHLDSEPERLLQSVTPSPGEIRKLMLAFGIIREPHLIVMDEPTNHLDLPSIRCLEEALAACPCALLLVSHDLPFLDATTGIEWHIERQADGMCELATDV